jgi:hypothetical protein
VPDLINLGDWLDVAMIHVAGESQLVTTQGKGSTLVMVLSLQR